MTLMIFIVLYHLYHQSCIKLMFVVKVDKQPKHSKYKIYQIIYQMIFTVDNLAGNFTGKSSGTKYAFPF
jgi:hypothetical protein